MSTFDKNAVEEALRLKSSHQGDVVVFTVGPSESKKAIREALAMGADKGVQVTADTTATDTLRTAELLAAAIKRSGPFDVIVCSEGSSDTYSGQVPPMLGEMLGAAFVSYARKIDVRDKTVRVERSLEDSIEVAEATVPIVVSVVSEINEPRYSTLIQIKLAGQKPLEELTGEQLLSSRAHEQASVVSMSVQQSSRKHIMIDGTPDESANKLVDALLKEGVLSP